MDYPIINPNNLIPGQRYILSISDSMIHGGCGDFIIEALDVKPQEDGFTECVVLETISCDDEDYIGTEVSVGHYVSNFQKAVEYAGYDTAEGLSQRQSILTYSDELANHLRKQEEENKYIPKGYTREEFLDEFNAADVEGFGLEFPEDVVDDDDRDSFYYDTFIHHLENKLWDSPKAEETSFQLSSILSFWEDVV